MTNEEMVAKWKKQDCKRILTQTFRNIMEANIFVATLGDNFISSVNTRGGIVVMYYDC